MTTSDGLTFTYLNDSAELPRGKYVSMLGNSIVEFADPDFIDNINPVGTSGWQIAGRATQFSPSRSVEYVDLRSGSPETSKGNIIIGDSLEFGITMDHPTLLGFQLAEANDYGVTINYDSVGQTTVASAGTKKSAVLTSATGFAKGSMFEVDLPN